ncbi:DUF1127 domain-containing protein [Tropicibacter oceani]|uniref:DUF1127 domain-containing protein n=1 Tax=Tropicibacter oceani TaxID=3058420 RepID=A0ABY8QEI9_9RHOB|nr:DUF1127 domain-containing protein [Tropicibacter oceani]WGW03015.1 DUF1127 domain-containing protein [Tropicibacter oceani]
MNGFFNTVRASLEKRARYNRTVQELSNMPKDVADDLGLSPADAHRIARKAVYG